MEALLFFIGIIGNVTSLLIFVAPISTFVRIVKNRSTEDFEPAPYVVTLLGCALWVYYGITKPGEFLVATVNGVGILFETIYVVLFLIYASPSARARTGILVGVLDVGFLGAIIIVTQLLIVEESLRVVVIGIVCACLNVMMYGSPLAIMKTVITTKSVEFMPFFLSFFLFLNGGVWAVYAFIDKDVFLGIPNGMGFLLGSVQLILYLIYMKTKVSKQLGQATEPLIDPSVEHDEEQGSLT